MPPRSAPLDTIDSKAVRGLVEARAVTGATILGRSGGWAVVIRYGSAERAVAAQRSRRMRLWRNLNTAASFVRQELGMSRFDVDAADHDPTAASRRRPDAAARLKRALSYDEWARRDLAEAVRQADDPATEWIDHDDAMAELRSVIAASRSS